jgi:hypothetical protein
MLFSQGEDKFNINMKPEVKLCSIPSWHTTKYSVCWRSTAGLRSLTTKDNEAWRKEEGTGNIYVFHCYLICEFFREETRTKGKRQLQCAKGHNTESPPHTCIHDVFVICCYYERALPLRVGLELQLVSYLQAFRCSGTSSSYSNCIGHITFLVATTQNATCKEKDERNCTTAHYEGSYSCSPSAPSALHRGDTI